MYQNYTIGRNQGVQVFMMTLLVTTPTGEFSIENLMPYFQSPTRNPPSRFGNSKGGILTKGSGSSLHGGGERPGRGSRPLGGGGGPLGASEPLSGGRPPSGGGPPKGGGGGFLVGSACVPFSAPWLGSP